MARHKARPAGTILEFRAFKGDALESTLDQAALPPMTGMRAGRNGLRYDFGEWLKRAGHDWKSLPEERICQLATDFFNATLEPEEQPRRFDCMSMA